MVRFASIQTNFTVLTVSLINLKECLRGQEFQKCVSSGVIVKFLNVYDGRIWKDSLTYKGSDFLNAPTNLAFAINVDWFQPFKRRNDRSVGVISAFSSNMLRYHDFNWPGHRLTDTEPWTCICIIVFFNSYWVYNYSKWSSFFIWVNEDLSNHPFSSQIFSQLHWHWWDLTGLKQMSTAATLPGWYGFPHASGDGHHILVQLDFSLFFFYLTTFLHFRSTDC